MKFQYYLIHEHEILLWLKENVGRRGEGWDTITELAKVRQGQRRITPYVIIHNEEDALAFRLRFKL